jgi:hypothetical protein
MPAPLYLRLWTATPWVFRWICTTWTGMAITAMAILGGVLRAAARLLFRQLGFGGDRDWPDPRLRRRRLHDQPRLLDDRPGADGTPEIRWRPLAVLRQTFELQ